MAGADGSWCLIESDPGVFTELLDSMGIKGLQVEELYSLEDTYALEDLKPIYGLIFLFKWESSSKKDAKASPLPFDPEARVFFAKQIIPNACATQAILNIALNIPTENIQLSEEMKEFRSFTSDFDSEMRGLAISNSETIRTVHNSFARSDPFFHDDKDDENDKRDREDAFHFTAFVPVDGKLYELDGLKPYPVCFGECDPRHWLEKATPIIMDRIQKYSGGEIRFSLMAVIKNRQVVYQEEKDRLQTELSKTKNDDKKAGHLKASIQRMETQIQREQEKMENHKKENVRRRFNYLPFIVDLFKCMAEKGELAGAFKQQ